MTLALDERPCAADTRRVPASDRRTLISKVLALVVVALVAAIAAGHLVRPFWVDELTTAWYIEGDWSSLWSRLRGFATNSPLYPVFMWSWSQLFGTSPLALRIPSTLAVIASAVVVKRTASTVDGPATGWLSVAIYFTLTEVFVTAGNARSYGFALLFISLMHQAALRWASTGRRRTGAAVALWATLAVHMHVLMGFGVITVGAAAWMRSRVSREWKRELRVPVTVGAVLLSSLTLVLLNSATNSGSFTPDFTPTFLMLVTVWITVPQLALVGFAVIAGRGLRDRAALKAPPFIYLFGAAVIPVLLSWSIAVGLGMGVFLERYLVSMLAPVAIVLAIVVSRIREPIGRAIALFGLVGIGLATIAQGAGGSSNWRDAVDWTNATTAGHDAVVLFEPQHIMGRTQEFFTDDDGDWIFENADSLTWVNPVETAHPINAPMFGLPMAVPTWGTNYLDALLEERVAGSDMVVLIGDTTTVERDYTDLLRERMSRYGYVEQPTPELDREVLLFTID